MITAAAAGATDDNPLVDRVAAAARAGVHLVQIRQPDRDARGLIRLVRRAVAAVRGTEARVLVNDRADLAIAAGAHGVHLRGDSLPAARVRTIVPPGFLIGRSVHSPDETIRVTSDGSIDYVIFGTVFPTASKPGARAGGLGVLAASCQATTVPVLAIGGMRPDRIGEVAQAGAAGIAAIGLFAEPAVEAVQATVERVVSAFDTPRILP
jgi:thiamine-phosphate pyrophosphorylase